MRCYTFEVEIEQDEDGRWGAAIPALPGCATWGYSKQEALETLQEAAQAYIEDVVEAGDEIPTGEPGRMEAPAVSVFV